MTTDLLIFALLLTALARLIQAELHQRELMRWLEWKEKKDRAE